MNNSTQKIASQIQREISLIFQNEVKNTKIGYLTITGVKLTNDFSLATVYYTIIGNDSRKKVTQEGIEASKGFIRSELAKRIHMKKVPELVFKADESLAYGNKIEGILKSLETHVDLAADEEDEEK